MNCEEMEEMERELDRISELEDFYQQGYQAAPWVVRASGCSVVDFMNDLQALSRLNQHPANKERDRGAMAWCKEQIDLAAPANGDFSA